MDFADLNAETLNEASAFGVDPPEATVPDQVLFWAASILLGGVDVSARAAGQIVTELIEGAARAGRFLMVPNPGAVDVSQWTGAPVIIDHLIIDSDGAVLETQRMFEGVVELAEYDPIANEVTFDCTDRFQPRIDAMTPDQIRALVPGTAYVDDVDDRPSGYALLEDMNRSAQLSVDADVALNLHSTPWLPKVTPDITYTPAMIFDETLRVTGARSRSITNSVKFEYGYRFDRLRERRFEGGWSYGRTFCEYVAESTTLPNKSMIRAALESTGCVIKTFGTTKLPQSGIQNCGAGDFAWVIHPDIREALAVGASWQIAKRFVQTVSEHYAIVVEAPESIDQIDRNVETISRAATNNTEKSSAEFEASAGPVSSMITGTDQVVDTGDFITDNNAGGTAPRTVADAMLDQGLAEAATTIAASHRQNTIEFECPLNLSLERVHTVEVDTPLIAGKGKVRALRHVLDIDSGAETTSVTVAISRKQGVASFAVTPLIRPEPPDTTGEIDDTGESPLPGMDLFVGTQLGGRIASGSYDPDADGYSGNYQTIEPGSEIFEQRFNLTAPAIDDDSRQEVIGNVVATYLLAVRNDPLTINAP